MKDDEWLVRLLPKLSRFALDKRVLELGCGGGRDSKVLCNAGFTVVALDSSQAAIDEARRVESRANFFCRDIRDPFPMEAKDVGAIIASLSIHYFNYAETEMIVTRIFNFLKPPGLFVCRLNSTNDRNYGACGYPKIEKDFYLVRGRQKRFFDLETVTALFSPPWKLAEASEVVIDRYELPKHVWEVVVEKP